MIKVIVLYDIQYVILCSKNFIIENILKIAFSAFADFHPKEY